MAKTNRRIPGAKLVMIAPVATAAKAESSPPPSSSKPNQATSLAEAAPVSRPTPRKPPSVRARKVWAITKATAMTILVAGASLGTAVTARRYVTTSPRFALTAVDVTGATRRTPDEIANEAGLEKGTNVFVLDIEAARDHLLGDPWIREAAVSRALPGTAHVTVVERDAAALVALGDLYISTSAGEIFKRWEAGDPVELPVITGLAAGDVADDREGAAKSIRRALDVVAEYEHMPLATKQPVEEVHVTNGDAIALTIGKSGTTLALGQPPYRKKFEEATRALAEIDRRGAKVDAVLLDNEVHPERVVVRLK